jgi:membrane protein
MTRPSAPWEQFVVLLTWLYLSAYVVLVGACFNAEMERQTVRDTTSGAEKPMGHRGAKMADTVADEARIPSANN